MKLREWISIYRHNLIPGDVSADDTRVHIVGVRLNDPGRRELHDVSDYRVSSAGSDIVTLLENDPK